MSNFYFFYQKEDEGPWFEGMSTDRDRITSQLRPPFTTVLDLDSIPEDTDYSKVHYKGPLYFDFDAGDDLPLVIDKFKEFIAKLYADCDFDVSQARMYLSGGKGFHIEIPEECFRPKPPAKGTLYLPYIYREVAMGLLVDTLDLKVYTGRKGRMWRTPNVQRKNGKFKVPITLDEAMNMDEDKYLELCSTTRLEPNRTPPSVCAKLSLLFDRALKKVQDGLKGQKKRKERSNKILDPWKAVKKNPPTLEKLMSGEIIRDGAGFQNISMQLAIYATSVGMSESDFLEKCKGLCENHVSDSARYNTPRKRRDELSRMYHYMDSSPMYDFDVGPLINLIDKSYVASDLGAIAEDDEDHEDAVSSSGDGSEDPKEDALKGLRRGFVMNSTGMFRKDQEAGSIPLCRASFKNIEALYDAETCLFQGFEFDLMLDGRLITHIATGSEVFTSSTNLRKFLMSHQASYQGTDADTTSLFDICQERAARRTPSYSYPREGFFVLNNPRIPDRKEPVMCYLTKDFFQSSLSESDPNYFHLRYKPKQATSGYNGDLNMAPDLALKHGDELEDLFKFNRLDIVAKCLGWFAAAHYTSLYHYLFEQFPYLQMYGIAGSGKTKTVQLHRGRVLRDVRIPSALALTAYALDQRVSSSTSLPLILDEFKPRELKIKRGAYEKLKDVLKQCYVGGEAGERGSVSKSDNTMVLIENKCTAPTCTMGEAIETETALIERSVLVHLDKSFKTPERTEAFERIYENPECVSALGRTILSMGYAVNLEKMRVEVRDLINKVTLLAKTEGEAPPDRMIYNQAIVIHGLTIVKRALQTVFDSRFDNQVDELIASQLENKSEEVKAARVHGMSETSKVVSRLALLSRELDAHYEMKLGKDYLTGPGWVEIRVERAYDQYRRFCVSINDTPLFDTMDAFGLALTVYSPVIDPICAASTLRPEGSIERVIRLDTAKLLKEGVQTFR